MNASLAFARSAVNSAESQEFMFFVIATGWMTFLVLGVAVHSACAIAVYRDAMKVSTRSRDNPTPTSTVLVGALVWAGGSLLLGIVGLAAYWILHHSAVGARRAEQAPRSFAADAAPIG
jgi:hypothetical protein